MTELLVWGEHIGNNKMIFIDDAVNGIKCNCICPGCGDKLIARQGERNASHFAHASNDQCIFAGESALHKLGKEIIAEGQSMMLPDNSVFSYSAAAIEKKIADFRPDAILINGEERLHIEIFVTHSVSFNKKNFFFDEKLKAIEIDLADLDRRISKDDLRKIILDEISRKHFIKGTEDLSLFNPMMHELVFTDAVVEEVVFHEVKIEEVKSEEVVFEEVVFEEAKVEEVVFEKVGRWYHNLSNVLGIALLFFVLSWIFNNWLRDKSY